MEEIEFSITADSIKKLTTISTDANILLSMLSVIETHNYKSINALDLMCGIALTCKVKKR